MKTTDLRGPWQPEDGLSHISRINDWVGSDSYAEGASSYRDPEPYVPRTPRLPYMLRTEATDRNGVLRRRGEWIELHASEVAPHHAQIPGIDYSAHRPGARAEALIEEVKAALPTEFKAEAKATAKKEPDK